MINNINELSSRAGSPSPLALLPSFTPNRSDPPVALPASSARAHLSGACFVIDLDNLLNNRDAQGKRLPRSRLDMLKFRTDLLARGVAAGTVCQNWPFSKFEDAFWRELGFQTVSTGRNCDPQVALAAIAYVDAGFRDVIIAAGDWFYADMAHILRECGVHVEVWSRRDSTAVSLMQAVDCLRYVDHLLY